MDRPKWLALLLVLGVLSMMVAPPSQVDAQASRFFPETGKTVAGRFLQYWLDNGGLAQQGYPISDELQEVSTVNGQSYTVQYFERAVFEKHPENAAPYDVLLSLLGSSLYKRNYPTGAPGQQASRDNPRYFGETGHTVGGAFRQYWEQHGGLAQQGLPLSDEFQEQSLTDGKTYTVQYFERAVFEYHPENNPPFNVLLSLLGRFSYKAMASATAAATATATAATAQPTSLPTATVKSPTSTGTPTVAAPTSTPTATAQPPTNTPPPEALGRLFFYATYNGDSTVRLLQPDLALPDPVVTNSIDVGWEIVTPLGDNMILLYRNAAGDGIQEVIRLDEGGYVRSLGFSQTNGAAKVVIANAYGTAFYYQPTINRVLIISYDSTSASFKIGHDDSAAPTWDLVTPIGADMVMFYNAATGRAIVRRISSENTLQTIKDLDLATGWTSIAQSKAGPLFFYNAKTGLVATGLVDNTGEFTPRGIVEKQPTGFSEATALGDYVFLYRRDGVGMLYSVIEDGGTTQQIFYGSIPTSSHIAGIR